VFSCDRTTIESYSLIEKNTASGNGGGIASLSKAFLYIGNGAKFHNNSANLHGGCLYIGGIGATLGRKSSPFHFTIKTLVLKLIIPCAEGYVNIKGCTAQRDGAGIYTFSSISFKSKLTLSDTILDSNFAMGSGGGMMIVSASVQISFNHRLSMIRNMANLDGGGIKISDGGQMTVLDEECPISICDAALRGNGVCDLQCMIRGCNWYVYTQHTHAHNYSRIQDNVAM
jgi:predicted outer membrane repeat protein